MRRTPTLIALTLAGVLVAAPESPAQGLFPGQGSPSGQTPPNSRAGPRPVQIGSRAFGATMGTSQAQSPGQGEAQSLADRLRNSSRLGALSKMLTSGVDLRPNQPNQPNQPQGQAAGANRVGVLSGTERFLRENRRPGSFVGTGSEEASRFVGAQSSGEEIVAPPADDLAAQEILETDRAPLPAPASVPVPGAGARGQRPYEPRLVVAFEVPSQAPLQISAAVVARLKAIPGLHPANRIEVSVEAGIATLQGEVASGRDRALIEQLILFEPGISEVKNALTVKPPATRPGESPPAERSPSDRDLRPKPRQ